MTTGSGGCAIKTNNIPDSVIEGGINVLNLTIGTFIKNEIVLISAPFTKGYKYLDSNNSSIGFTSYNVYTTGSGTVHCHNLDLTGTVKFPIDCLDNLVIGDRIIVFTQPNFKNYAIGSYGEKIGKMLLQIIGIDGDTYNCNIISASDVIINSTTTLTSGQLTDSNSNCYIQFARKA